MTMKHAIAIAFSLTLTGVFAMPPRASAQFDLDLQATEISNQVQELLNRVTQYTTLFTQFTSLDCSAQGMAVGAQATPVAEAAVRCDTLNMIGAFKDSYRQLLQAPTNLLNTPVPLPNWRDVLQAADTVTEADIRNVYPGGTGAADAAVATFERRRNYADRSVVLAHAQRVLWPSIVKFSQRYFESLLAHAVPFNEAAVSRLSHSAMGLDVYTWLAQRLHRVRLGKAAFVPWVSLKEQFGPDYGRMNNFKRVFRTTLKQVQVVYREAKFNLDGKGIHLRHSPPPVLKRYGLVHVK